jgi:hypothetical protein
MSNATESPVPRRAIAVDGVWWSVVAQERRPPFARETSPATYVWFTLGQASRVAYVTRAAREVLEWPEHELRALFDQAVLATAG